MSGQPAEGSATRKAGLGLVAATKKETEEHPVRLALEAELAQLFRVTLPLGSNLHSQAKEHFVADQLFDFKS